MEKRYPSREFDAVVDEEGKVLLPRELRTRLAAGARLTLRVTEGTVSGALRARKVTEAEVEAIARMQREEREQVIEYLISEGALAGDRAFARRARPLM